MRKDRKYYDEVKQEAENGNPHAMLELAKLYSIGVFQDESDEEYVHWLQQFFSCPSVNALLITLDADDDEEPGEYFYKSQEIVSSLGLEEESALQMEIIEAGVSLGLYFRYSTDKEELFCARDSLYAAWIVSRFDYLEVNESNSIIDVVSILSAIDTRIKDLGYEEGMS